MSAISQCTGRQPLRPACDVVELTEVAPRAWGRVRAAATDIATALPTVRCPLRCAFVVRGVDPDSRSMFRVRVRVPVVSFQ